MRVTMDRFAKAVQAAIDSIPDSFQPYLEDIEFVVAGSSPEGLMGHYEGGTALDADGWPARIILFRRSHEECCDTWDALVEEVRRTVLHEVGHHFGMDEDELPY